MDSKTSRFAHLVKHLGSSCWKPLLVLCCFLVATLSIWSCTLPPSTVGLDEVMLRHGLDNPLTDEDAKDGKHRFRNDYRCTAGAHRGASLDYRENTTAALLAAENSRKYDFIEFDVQYSGDRKIVLHHDLRLLRQFGSLKKVGETGYSELLKISDGELPAYAQVIDQLRKNLNIEIKSQGDEEKDRQLAEELIADLKKRDRLDDVMVSSISADVVSYIEKRYPDVYTGQIFWLTSSTYLPFDGLTRKLYDELAATRADYALLHVANLRNLEDLLTYKPEETTLVFWDFDDSMYILHKDFSDRLWGQSAFSNFWEGVRYKTSRLWQ